tara:strand:+ start:467 stop:901 length:435 start_codon:yes stop_codon:yes gene_type:complete
MIEIDQRLLSRLTEIADVMLPETDQMPSVSGVEAFKDRLPKVLDSRPDLEEGLRTAIDLLPKETFNLSDLDGLLQKNPEAYTALTTVVAASYYQVEEVKVRIGYPGQVPKTYDPYAYVEWVQEGLLDPVVDRGPIWRDPREESK